MKNILSRQKIIIICGPTGVGKTRFAIELARTFSGEIIGADSMQVYRHMDIGTAKPTASERAAVPHHLVDCIKPDQPFNAVDYARQAGNVLLGLHKKGVLPFVVGGTGLYIKALQYGLFKMPSSDEKLRRHLRREAELKGSQTLHYRLSELDPVVARRIHPNDAFRITRALEVLETTGNPISSHHENHRFRQSKYDALTLGLTLPRDQLYDRINRRVDAMLNAGLVEEVQQLLNRNISPDAKSMKSLGYRHICAFLKGTHSWDDTVVTLKRDHRRYAKRQMTWFNADGTVNWFQPNEIIEAAELVAQFLRE